jgi:CRP-like cAMP-binding protein
MIDGPNAPIDWKTPDGHSPLCAFFAMIHPISNEAIDVIDRGTFPVNLRKGSYLVKPGSSSNDLYWVMKGVIRGYIKEEGKEITTWINEENEVVGSIRNFGLEIETDEYVQAIDDSALIAIPHSVITHLYANFPEANFIGRVILEENYRGAEERAFISRIPNAEKRYKRFVATRGTLLNRIPLKYIASYLGMTLETMSRIRGKK